MNWSCNKIFILCLWDLPEVYVAEDKLQSQVCQDITPQKHYSLKIINRQLPGVGYVIEIFETDIFSTKDEVKDKIMQVLSSKKHIKDSDEIQFGYIMPGHGFKGKQYVQ